MNQNGNTGHRNYYKYFHKNSTWTGLKQNYINCATTPSLFTACGILCAHKEGVF